MMKARLINRWSSAAVSTLFAVTGCAAGAAENRPNVLFFLVDDLGWSDSSVYGSTFYRTPSMERLARSSIRFTNAYSASPLCSPSRASIMSGQYPARHGMTTAWGHTSVKPNEPDYDLERVPVTSEVLLPMSRRFLAREQYTMAEAFRDAGYRTGFVGKWHMGLDPQYWPEEQGFEFTFHGAPDPGPASYFSPYPFRAGTVTDGPEGEHIADRAAREAIGFMGRDDDRPFFLCLWFWSVHTPFQAKPELVEYYKKHPDPRGIQKSPTYAAMVEAFDTALGSVLDYLEESGLDKNTVIVFTSDNGGVDLKTVKADGEKATCNAPFKSGKGSLWEGGSRVPAMIRWPGVADQEQVSEAVISGIDYYPTLLEICGIQPNPEQVIDGISLVSLLKGNGLDRDAVYCFFPHNFSERSPPGAWVRQGNWKLTEVFYVSDLHPEKYILTDLENDIGEMVNLAGKYPERVELMAGMLRKHYMTLCERPPMPNPKFNASLLPTAGWIGAARNDLPPKLTDGMLQVSTQGISTRALPRQSGVMTLRFSLKTDRKGPLRMFWSDRNNWQFSADRSSTQDLSTNDRFQTLEKYFETSDELIGIRLDVNGGTQPVWFKSIELLSEDGKILKQWSFE